MTVEALAATRGYVESFLGPAHGFAGNVLALAALEDGRRDELARRATETLTRLAVREDFLRVAFAARS